MTVITPVILELALLPEGTPTLADCLLRLEQMQDLSPTRRRDMASGLRRVAQVLDQPSALLPADPAWLRPRLGRVAPAAHGLSAKRWANILSDARAALLVCGVVEHRRRRDYVPTELWSGPWQRLLASNDLRLTTVLRPFLQVLDRLQVAPDQVGDLHLVAYRDALAQSELRRSPDEAVRRVVHAWNKAAAELQDWPRQQLSRVNRRDRITLPLDTFPTSFAADLARFVGRMERPDLLDPTALPAPLRPATIRHRRAQVLRFASALVYAGVEPERIRSLADLVDPGFARRGLGWLLARQQGETGPALADLAILLKTLARHHVSCPPETLRAIEDFARRLAVPPQKGLSLKNRERLRTLDEEEKLRRLITLPAQLFERCKGKSTRQAALLREEALAIAILQGCPIRRKNLVGLHLERNLRRMGDGRVFLVFEAGETKTRRPLEFELPKEVVRRLEEHLALRSPTLCAAGVPWLFPRRDGAAPMDPSRLSSRISERIRKETGLEVHPHLFRHLCAQLWLRAHPGHYESLRRLLGHSQLSSTLDVYAGLEAGTATRAYAELIAQVVEG